MYTAQEACNLLGVAKSTLFRWEKEKKIPRAQRDLWGNRTYSLSDLTSILQSLSRSQRNIAAKAIECQILIEKQKVQMLESLLEKLKSM